MLLTIWGADDAITQTFNLQLETVIWTGRVLVLGRPFLAFFITRQLCRRLQQRDRQRERTGDSLGVIVPLPGGGYGELVEPATVAHSGDPGLPADKASDAAAPVQR